MLNRSSILKNIITVLLIFCLIVTGSLAVIIATHYDQISRLVKATLLVRTQAIQAVTANQLIDGATTGIVGSLQDPYSVYLDPKHFQELNIQIQGSFGGIGIIVGQKDQNRLTVMAPPFKGTPAEAAGIKQGDVIVEIDGKSTQEMDLDTAIGFMRGAPGTKLVIGMQRGSQTLKFNLTREVISIPTVQGKILEGEPKIAYIQILQFSSNTDQELGKTINELSSTGFKGIILDLRNNPGGDFNTAVKVADYFVDKGPVVKVVGRNGQEEVYQASGNNLQLPLVVLVNEGSASASEIVSGAIKDRQAGTLVGTKTFGKGLVQTVYPLTGNAGLKLTTAKYLTPNGNDINKKGIEPEVKVELPANAVRDTQLDKAVEVLKTQIK